MLAVLVCVINPKSSPHIAGGMAFGDVEFFEIVGVPLYLWSLDGGESHRREGAANLPDDASGDVEAALGDRPSRHGDVDGVC